MNAVMEWVKANVLIVVFGALMLAAAIVLPYFASGMNQSVREMVATRAQNYSKLVQLEKGEILPGHQGVVSEGTLRNYQDAANSAAADAAAVRDAAIEHNRKSRGCVLDKSLFPDPPQNMVDVMPLRFYEAISDAYGKLLTDVSAGMPPDPATTRQQLDQVRTQFVTQDLKKDVAEKLSPEEEKKLSDMLSAARVSLYAQAATNVGLFLSMDQLGVPQWNQANQPSLGELFNWQWQFWIADDILRALHEANKADQSVVRAPVKHILGFSVQNLPAVSEGNRSSQGSPARGFGAGGFGGGATGDSGGAGGAPGAAEPSATAANPKAPVPLNYAVSLTGRTTNPLYDVINVDLDIVVETARLPQVIDAISKYNFMTVTSLKLSAVDKFAALENGFYYGAAPVSEVQMTIETVWLRAWTQEFMPKSVKRQLGIPDQAPAQGAAPSA